MKPLLAVLALLQGGSWTVFVTNDNCPDYTWGIDEKQTRDSIAELVRAHLNEMRRTDGLAPEVRNRYNMAVLNEAFFFLEKYPERKAELISRIKEGRLYVSPFLNNSLWGMQSSEGVLRSLYAARRLEKEWGVKFDTAHHIELPSLPWGVASLLAGSGVRWLSVPFLDYDSTFKGLDTPPAFRFEGPDGQAIRVWMDRFASLRANYVQGSAFLKDAKKPEWFAHYESARWKWPQKFFLLSGTHGDISPKSQAQVQGFSDSIREWNSKQSESKLVNATFQMYFDRADAAEKEKPFLETRRGCFGHSWDLWPVSVASAAAGMREGERRYLAAEALLAVAALGDGRVAESTRPLREKAEWHWAMLGDHAWNGTNAENKRLNAALRIEWAKEFQREAAEAEAKAWATLGVKPDAGAVTLFNSLNVKRRALVRIEDPGEFTSAEGLLSQLVDEDGKRVLYFVSPEMEGFGFAAVKLGRSGAGPQAAGAVDLDGKFYRGVFDRENGGLSSLTWKPGGLEVLAGSGRTLGQTVYFDGSEHKLSDVRASVVTAGPVLTRVRIEGRAGPAEVRNEITVYSGIDRIDFDSRIRKTPGEKEERLTHHFPVARAGAEVRIETTGSVLRPFAQPRGDLLPGADARRFAVQGFVDATLPSGAGVTVAPLDAFTLRQDLGSFTFEALGNDQNYKEVSRGQGGVTEFRFRYALRAHQKAKPAEIVAWSRDAATPLLVARGRLPRLPAPAMRVDSDRAIVLALKPAEDGGTLLRVWETAGLDGPLTVAAGALGKAWSADLLERTGPVLGGKGGVYTTPLRAHGFAAIRLARR